MANFFLFHELMRLRGVSSSTNWSNSYPFPISSIKGWGFFCNGYGDDDDDDDGTGCKIKSKKKGRVIIIIVVVVVFFLLAIDHEEFRI